jgi:NitT/TauT family transport system substrate-binding protein
MGKLFHTIDYRDLGIDWMEHVLFTTGEIIKKYPNIVQAVVTGRYKGFKWAFENPRETIEILKEVDENLDPFGGVNPRLSSQAEEAPLRVNPEQDPAFRPGSRRVDFAREVDAISPTKVLMITPETKRYGLGYISRKKWENVARDMLKSGLLEKISDMKKVYTERFPSGVNPK